MTVIDGLTNTWDFKDRLVRVEDTNMVANYTYDYTDRRIIKNVGYKPGSANFTNHESRITTLYINKYFEVREHDAPTKYVWDGNTRVARVTGSLNTNVRVQRLRVYPGWNLCSLAVTATNALSQLNSLSALGGEGQGEVASSAFRWFPATQTWLSVTASDTLPAGTVLWLQATTNATLAITGVYTDPTNRIVTASGDFLPSAGLEAWCWTNSASLQPSALSLWFYDSATPRWLALLPPPLELQSGLPPFIAPGQAVFARADAQVQLEVPESALRIRYYHQDHVGSSSCMSDATGSSAEQSCYFPFGSSRLVRVGIRTAGDYRFSQKEEDAESGFHHFEARFLHAPVGHFMSVDPVLGGMRASLSVEGGGSNLAYPQAQNPFSYGRNNPLRYVDPSGTVETDLADTVKANLEKYNETHDLNPEAQKELRITSTDRSIEEQSYYILTRSAYKVRASKAFKETFSSEALAPFGSLRGKSWARDAAKFRELWKGLTQQAQQYLLGHIEGLAGKWPGYAHVGGKAIDVNVSGLDEKQKAMLQQTLAGAGLIVYREDLKSNPVRYGNGKVSMKEATTFHVVRSNVEATKTRVVSTTSSDLPHGTSSER